MPELEPAGSEKGPSGRAAILIVAGGDDPGHSKWLESCLRNLVEYTDYPDYQLYVWNNDVGDERARQLTDEITNCVLFDADPDEPLGHPHAGGLQKLYEIARRDGLEYIVTFDTDALALRRDWLTRLIGEVDQGAALAGVWRDEKVKIEPYVHPSCLCTTVRFVEDHRLRFDDLPRGGLVSDDTLSKFTRAAREADLPIHKLWRSNKNELHHMIGGIYGDTIYHHHAGSRLRPTVGTTDTYSIRQNRRIRDLGARMLFEHRDEYFAWLRGDATNRCVFFVLGMHRSGTSCLTACLEQAGVFLGAVDRDTSIAQPRGKPGAGPGDCHQRHDPRCGRSPLGRAARREPRLDPRNASWDRNASCDRTGSVRVEGARTQRPRRPQAPVHARALAYSNNSGQPRRYVPPSGGGRPVPLGP